MRPSEPSSRGTRILFAGTEDTHHETSKQTRNVKPDRKDDVGLVTGSQCIASSAESPVPIRSSPCPGRPSSPRPPRRLRPASKASCAAPVLTPPRPGQAPHFCAPQVPRHHPCGTRAALHPRPSPPPWDSELPERGQCLACFCSPGTHSTCSAPACRLRESARASGPRGCRPPCPWLSRQLAPLTLPSRSWVLSKTVKHIVSRLLHLSYLDSEFLEGGRLSHILYLFCTFHQHSTVFHKYVLVDYSLINGKYSHGTFVCVYVCMHAHATTRTKVDLRSRTEYPEMGIYSGKKKLTQLSWVL